MHLAHKWTQKWTKYATGEDAGSGVWTIGHARTRAYTRVHARTRAYTRVHARTRAYTRVHAGTCPNAQFDAFSAQMDTEMDKIRHRRRRGFGRVDDRTRAYTRVHARTFPCTYFGSLNAQMDRGSPYDEYNTLKTALDCDVYRQSQSMSRAKTETEIVRVWENVRPVSFSVRARHEPKSI